MVGFQIRIQTKPTNSISLLFYLTCSIWLQMLQTPFAHAVESPGVLCLSPDSTHSHLLFRFPAFVKAQHPLLKATCFSPSVPTRPGSWPFPLHFLKMLLACSSQGIHGKLEAGMIQVEKAFNSSNTQHKTTSWFLNVLLLPLSPEIAPWSLPPLGTLALAILLSSLSIPVAARSPHSCASSSLPLRLPVETSTSYMIRPGT